MGERKKKRRPTFSSRKIEIAVFTNSRAKRREKKGGAERKTPRFLYYAHDELGKKGKKRSNPKSTLLARSPGGKRRRKASPVSFFITSREGRGERRKSIGNAEKEWRPHGQKRIEGGKRRRAAAVFSRIKWEKRYSA